MVKIFMVNKDWIEKANRVQPGLARRYVHNANFENAHHYNLLSGKDKPFQASKFANLVIDGKIEDPECLKWLNDIMGEKKIMHDMSYISENKKTKEIIDEEKKSYFDL